MEMLKTGIGDNWWRGEFILGLGSWVQDLTNGPHQEGGTPAIACCDSWKLGYPNQAGYNKQAILICGILCLETFTTLVGNARGLV